jgi:hypothetical protein
VYSKILTKKKCNGYWTKEKLQEEVNKYRTRGEFWNKSSVSSLTASRKLIDELFQNHPNQGFSVKRKKDEYWTKEKLQIEADKYENRINLKKNNYPAYITSCRKKFIDELFQNHVNNGYLDKENWKENRYIIYAYELLEYKKVYVGLTNNVDRRDKEHLFDEKDALYKFVKENEISYPDYKILEKDLKSTEAQKQEKIWVDYYKNHGWSMFNIIKTGSLGGSIKIWSNKKLQEEANKYKTRGKFFNNSSGYGVASSKKLMDELFKNHTNQGYTDKQKISGYWTIEKLREIVDKYNTRDEFRKNDNKFWIIAHNRNFMNDLFKNHPNQGYIRNQNKNK